MGDRFKRSSSMATLMVLLAFVVMACHTTQTPREQIDDNAIHAAVKAKLTADRFSNILNIDVNVTNGVVTLAGEVPNEKVKQDAEDEARSVRGVKSVKNNLQVSPPKT